MKTSKFFLTTLFAAAAMTTSAYAADYSVYGTADGTKKIIVGDTLVSPQNGVYTFSLTSWGGDHTIDGLEITAGQTVLLKQDGGGAYVLDNQLTGSGTLVVERVNTGTGAQTYVTLTEDLTDFSGTLAFRKTGEDGDNYSARINASAKDATIEVGQNVRLGLGTTNIAIAGLTSSYANARVLSYAEVHRQNDNDGVERTLTLAGNDSYSYAGIIGSTLNQGSLNLTKTGAGTQTLSGTSYLGDVSVSDGTLAFTGAITNIAGTVVVSKGELSLGGNVYLHKTISVSGGKLTFADGLSVTLDRGFEYASVSSYTEGTHGFAQSGTVKVYDLTGTGTVSGTLSSVTIDGQSYELDGGNANVSITRYSTYYVNSGTVDYESAILNGGHFESIQNVQIQQGATLAIASTSGDIVINKNIAFANEGTIDGDEGSLKITAGGIATLTGNGTTKFSKLIGNGGRFVVDGASISADAYDSAVEVRTSSLVLKNGASLSTSNLTNSYGASFSISENSVLSAGTARFSDGGAYTTVSGAGTMNVGTFNFDNVSATTFKDGIRLNIGEGGIKRTAGSEYEPRSQVFNNATLGATAKSWTSTSDIALQFGNTVTVDTALWDKDSNTHSTTDTEGATITIAGAVNQISNAPATLVKEGMGTLVLAGTANLSGINVNQGGLVVEGVTTVADTQNAGIITLQNNGRLVATSTLQNGTKLDVSWDQGLSHGYSDAQVSIFREGESTAVKTLTVDLKEGQTSLSVISADLLAGTNYTVVVNAGGETKILNATTGDAGSLNIALGSKLEYWGAITAPAGTIAVTGEYESGKSYKVIDYTGTDTAEKDYSFVNADNKLTFNRDLYISNKDQSTLYVNRGYSDEIGDIEENGGIVGYNAFGNLKSALVQANTLAGETANLTTTIDLTDDAYVSAGMLTSDAHIAGITNAGTYNIINGAGTLANYEIEFNPDAAEGSYVVNIGRDLAEGETGTTAHLTLSKLTLRKGVDMTIKNARVDFNQFQGGSAYFSVYKDSTLDVTNSTIGYNPSITGEDNPEDYTAYEDKGNRLYENWGPRFSIYGTANFTNSNLYVYVGQADGTGFDVKGNGSATLTGSTMSTALINVGGSYGSKYLLDPYADSAGLMATLTIDSSTIYNTQYRGDANSSDVVNGIRVGYADVAGKLVIRNNSNVDFTKVRYNDTRELGLQVGSVGTVEISGSTVTLPKATIADGGKLSVADSTFTATSVANSGEFTVSGTSTLNIDSFTGEVVNAADGAVIKDSTIVGGTVFANGDLTFQGANTIGTLNPGWYNHTITIGEGASVATTTTDRTTLSYENTIDVDGTIADAKTADKSALTASLNIASGLSLTGDGAGATLNVDNAYVVFGNSSSKNSTATGEFNMNFTNSIVDFTNGLAFEASTKEGLAPTFNVMAKDSVVTLTGKLKLAHTGANVTFDNSSVTVGDRLKVNGTLTLKNASAMTVAGNADGSGENTGIAGTINVLSGSSLDMADATSGAYPLLAAESAQINVSGANSAFSVSKIENSGTISVSNAGMLSATSLSNSGILNIAGGSAAVAGSVVSTGTLNVTDAGALTLTNGGQLTLGAELDANGNATNFASSAENAESKATFSGEGTEVWINHNEGTLSQQRNNYLLVSDGAEVKANSSIKIAGTALFTGDGTTASSVHTSVYGEDADEVATLTVANGASVNASGKIKVGHTDTADRDGKLVIDHATATAGSVTVQAGSSVDMNGGSLTANSVSNAGTITVDGGVLNSAVTGSGEVYVANGATLNNKVAAKNVYVTSGDFTSSADLVASGTFYAGHTANATNTTIATGTALNAGHLFVGKEAGAVGSQKLTVAEGATVNAWSEGVNVRADGVMDVHGEVVAATLLVRGTLTASGENALLETKNVLSGGTTVYGEEDYNGEATVAQVEIKDGAKVNILNYGRNAGSANFTIGHGSNTNRAGIVTVSDGGLLTVGTAGNSKNGNVKINADTGTLAIEGGSFTANTVENNNVFTVAGTSTVNVGALSGNAMVVTGGTLTDSTIGSGNVAVIGDAALAGTNTLGGVNKVLNGSTLTVAGDATAHYLMAGEDNYFAFGNGYATKGGRIDINGNLTITQYLNANANGVINVNDGANVKAAVIAVENGDVADAASSGVLNVNAGATVQSAFLNVFNGGKANIAGTVTLGDHETDQWLLNVSGNGTVNVTGALNVKGSGKIASDGTLSVNGGSFAVTKTQYGTGTLINAGTINVTGASDIVANFAGDVNAEGKVYFTNVTLDGDTKITSDVNTGRNTFWFLGTSNKISNGASVEGYNIGIDTGATVDVDAFSYLATNKAALVVKGTLNINGDKSFVVDTDVATPSSANRNAYAANVNMSGSGSLNVSNAYMAVYDVFKLSNSSTVTLDNARVDVGVNAHGAWFENGDANRVGYVTTAQESTLTLKNGSLMVFSGSKLDYGLDNAGTTNIESGSQMVSSFGMNNSGTLKIVEGSSLTVGSNLTNDSNANLGFTNSGVINVDASTLTAKTLTNSGTINVSGNSNVSISGKLDNYGELTSTGGSVTVDALYNWGGEISVTNGTSVVKSLYNRAGAETSFTGGTVSFDYINQKGTLNFTDTTVLGSREVLIYDNDAPTTPVVNLKNATWNFNYITVAGKDNNPAGGMASAGNGKIVLENNSKLIGNNLYISDLGLVDVDDPGTDFTSTTSVVSATNSSLQIANTIYVGTGAELSLVNSSLSAGTVINSGTINVSGASSLSANVSGTGWIYMKDAVLDGDTNVQGGKIRFAQGTSTLDGATIDNGVFQVGIGAYHGTDENVDTEKDVTVNVKNNSVIGSSGEAYDGWVGSGFYDTDAKKAAAMTDARYTLNIENSIAAFGYLHVSQDGILNVSGNAANKVWYNNSDYTFYAGDLIVNGTATFDGSDVLALYTNVSCDNGTTTAPGHLIIKNGAYYEAERHNGAVDGTNFTISKTGVVDVLDNATLYIGEHSSIAADATLNVAGSTLISKGTVNNSGTISLTNGGMLDTAALSVNAGSSVSVDKATLNVAGTLYNYGTLALDNGASATVKQLYGRPYSTTTLDNGSTLTVTNYINQKGNLALAGASTLNASGLDMYLYDNNNADNVVELSLSEGSTMTVADLTVGGKDSEEPNGNAKLVVDASTLNATSRLLFANLGDVHDDRVFQYTSTSVSGEIKNNSTVTTSELYVGTGAELSIADSAVSANSIANTGTINVYGTGTLSGALSGGILNFGSADKAVDTSYDVTGQGASTINVVNGEVTFTGTMADDVRVQPLNIGRYDLTAASGTATVADGAIFNAHQVYIGENESANVHTLNVDGTLNAMTSVYTKAMGALKVTGTLDAGRYLQAAGKVSVSGENALVNVGNNNGTSIAIGADVAGLSAFTIADGATVNTAAMVKVGYPDDVLRTGTLSLTNGGTLKAASLTVDTGSSVSVDNATLDVAGKLTSTDTIALANGGKLSVNDLTLGTNVTVDLGTEVTEATKATVVLTQGNRKNTYTVDLAAGQTSLDLFTTLNGGTDTAVAVVGQKGYVDSYTGYTFTQTGNVALDYTSTLAYSGTITAPTGSITIDTEGYVSGYYKVIDYTGTGTAADYSTLVGENDLVKDFLGNGDLYVSNGDVSTLYVDSTKYTEIGEIVDNQLVGYSAFDTVVTALDKVQDGGTIMLTEGSAGNEVGKEIDFTKSGTFTLTGNAPQHKLPIITVANETGTTTLNIKDANLAMAELDARQNATINVVDSTIVGANGNDIVKSYYNGTINLSGTSDVDTMQVTTMGYINLADTAKLEATWQTNVYGNGLITVSDDAVFSTAGLHITGKAYSGRDNTDADRVGKAAEIVVDGGTLKSLDYDHAYYYETSRGVNIGGSGADETFGTEDDTQGVLTIKNGGLAQLNQSGGVKVNQSGAIVIDNGTLTVKAKDGSSNVVNNGLISVTGESTIEIGTLTGNAIAVREGAKLTANVGGYGDLAVQGDAELANVTLGEEIWVSGTNADGSVATATVTGSLTHRFGLIGGTDVNGNMANYFANGYYSEASGKLAVASGAAYKFEELAIHNNGTLEIAGNATGSCAYTFSDSAKIDILAGGSLSGLTYLTLNGGTMNVAGTFTNEGQHPEVADRTTVSVGENAKLNVDGTFKLTAGKLVNAGTITLGADASFTVNSLDGANGSIVADLTNASGDIVTIIDGNAASNYGSVSLNNNGAYNWYVAENDLRATTLGRETVYANSAYTSQDAVGAGKAYGWNAFNVISSALTTPGASTIKLESDVSEVLTTDVYAVIGNDLTITADSAYTASMSNNGTSCDLVLGGSHDNDVREKFTIGENVTLEVAGSRLVWAGYYGDDFDLIVDGTLKGGQLWIGADTTVSETGKLVSAAEAFVLRRGVKVTVNGNAALGATEAERTVQIDANYFSLLAGTIEANNTAIESGVIYINNTGGYAYEGGVFLNLNNTTWNVDGNIQMTTENAAAITLANGSVMNVAGDVKLSAANWADTVLKVDSTSALNIDGKLDFGSDFSKLGMVEIDMTNWDGVTRKVIDTNGITGVAKTVSGGVEFNNDYYATDRDQSTLYVHNTAYTGAAGDIANNNIVGYNAFDRYDDAFKAATNDATAANADVNATIVVEATPDKLESPDYINYYHKDYTNLDVLVKSGAALAFQSSKLNIASDFTFEAGSSLFGAPLDSHVPDSRLDVRGGATLTIGELGEDKKALVNLLDYTENTAQLVVSSDEVDGVGKLIVNNAIFKVGDMSVIGEASFTDTEATLGGIVVFGQFDEGKPVGDTNTMTNTTMAVKGHNLIIENEKFGTDNLLNRLAMDNSSITIDDGVAGTAANDVVIGALAMTNGSNVTVESGTAVAVNGALTMANGSTMNVGSLTVAEDASITITDAGNTDSLVVANGGTIAGSITGGNVLLGWDEVNQKYVAGNLKVTGSVDAEHMYVYMNSVLDVQGALNTPYLISWGEVSVANTKNVNIDALYLYGRETLVGTDYPQGDKLGSLVLSNATVTVDRLQLGRVDSENNTVMNNAKVAVNSGSTLIVGDLAHGSEGDQTITVDADSALALVKGGNLAGSITSKGEVTLGWNAANTEQNEFVAAELNVTGTIDAAKLYVYSNSALNVSGENASLKSDYFINWGETTIADTTNVALGSLYLYGHEDIANSPDILPAGDKLGKLTMTNASATVGTLTMGRKDDDGKTNLGNASLSLTNSTLTVGTLTHGALTQSSGKETQTISMNKSNLVITGTGTLSAVATVTLKEKSSLTAGSLVLAAGSSVAVDASSEVTVTGTISGAGNVTIASGATFAGAEGAEGATIEQGVVVTLANEGMSNVTLTAAGESFVFSGATAITNLDISSLEGVEVSSNNQVIFAWDIGVESGEVTVSTTWEIPSDIDTGVMDIVIFHKKEGTWQEVTDLFGEFDYESGSMSFTTSDFSSYVVLAIPEPSTFGLLSGLAALVFVGGRRRRRNAK